MQKLKLSLIICILFTAVLLVWASTTPPAGSVIENHESSSTSSYIGKYSGNQVRQAQQFYLDSDDPQPVSGIGILLKSDDYGDPQGDITITLYDNASGNVPGDPVSGTQQSFTPVLGEWNYIDYGGFGLTVSSGSGNKYWIVADLPEQSDNNAYCWMRSTSNTYARGYRKTFNSDGTETWSGSQTGDFSFRIYGDGSLNVCLSSCRAAVCPEGVRIEWRTESEYDIIGFNVLRGDDPDGPFVTISGALIKPKSGGSAGASYSFLDRNSGPAGDMYYEIEEVRQSGSTLTGPFTVRIPENKPGPQSFEILGNYPNPFNPDTKIRFVIPAKESGAVLSLNIRNVLGRHVRTVDRHRFGPGEQEVCWDGRDDQGRPLPGGVYFFSVENGREIMGVRKMVKCE